MKAKMRTNTEPEVTTDISTAADMTTTVESEDDDTILLDRDTYRRIKKMDRASLEALIQDIYESGHKKGLKEAQDLINTSEDLVQQAEVLVAKGQKTVDEVSEKIKGSTDTRHDTHTVDFDMMRNEIRGISGIGEKRADSIMEIVRKYIRE